MICWAWACSGPAPAVRIQTRITRAGRSLRAESRCWPEGVSARSKLSAFLPIRDRIAPQSITSAPASAKVAAESTDERRPGQVNVSVYLRWLDAGDDLRHIARDFTNDASSQAAFFWGDKRRSILEGAGPGQATQPGPAAQREGWTPLMSPRARSACMKPTQRVDKRAMNFASKRWGLRDDEACGDDGRKP